MGIFGDLVLSSPSSSVRYRNNCARNSVSGYSVVAMYISVDPFLIVTASDYFQDNKFCVDGRGTEAALKGHT